MATQHAYRLDDRYLADDGVVFLTGIQALARLPLEPLRVDRRAGRPTAAFVSGYPGAPLGGYDRAVAEAAAIAKNLPSVCRPGMNEVRGYEELKLERVARMREKWALAERELR